MATAHALKLCPNLVLVKGRMDEYVEASRQIRKIFERYTDKIEPLSLDEAYLDVSDCKLFSGSATLIAEDIRKAIRQETGLTASAGVAPIKFVAKIASDENKPDGICVITPDKLDYFVKTLTLGKIPGVGKVTVQKLHNLGLYTCDDIRTYPLEQLIKRFGKFGPVIWNRSHAIDDRDLSLSRERKSVGVERTLSEDILTKQQCLEMIETLYPKLEERLCVKRCNYIDQYSGEEYLGIASNYLCDLVSGESLSINGPFGQPFVVPKDKDADLLLIGMGTGIAPFRAFVKHLYRDVGDWRSKIRLFYGAKSGLDLLYMNDHKDDFAQYYDEQTFAAFKALSPRAHWSAPVDLDHAIEQRAAEVLDILTNKKGYIYIAGRLNIEQTLDKVFSRIVGSADNWQDIKSRLIADKRWMELIY